MALVQTAFGLCALLATVGSGVGFSVLAAAILSEDLGPLWGQSPFSAAFVPSARRERGACCCILLRLGWV